MATFCEILPGLCRFPSPDPDQLAVYAAPLTGAAPLAALAAPISMAAGVAEAGFLATPWIFTLAVVALLVWLVSRNWAIAVIAAAALGLVGLLGVWEPAMRTVSLASLGLAAAVVIGLPLGLVAGGTVGVRAILMPLFRALEAVPALAILPVAAILFGVNPAAALAATVLHALAPVVLGAERALRGADPDAMAAARAFGASSWQRFSAISLPLAGPALIAGIAGSAAKAFSMALLAGLIGATGLGRDIIDAITTADPVKALLSAAAAALIAIVLVRTARAGRERLVRMGDAVHG